MYEASVSVDFECSREVVYGILSNLGRYPEWNHGMIYISHTGPMYAGLKFETRTRVLGQINAADVEVVHLVPPALIRLQSKTGLVSYNAVYRLKDRANGGSMVTCDLKFEFSKAVLSLAHEAIEGMARDRLENDLLKLAKILDNKAYH
ncbi:MAG TPA: SRPBCC family protein [Candidatus Saccharimonadia bacterium]|jgi:hypothetical protein